MPSWTFGSDTNQQLFEQDLADRGLSFKRAAAPGVTEAEGDPDLLAELAQAYGGQPSEDPDAVV